MGHVLGIAGTAKNTGKTTTLQAAARYLRMEGRPLFLTSIGYDGEDLDGVTGLPKPKIAVQEGDRVATALPLLRSSSAMFKDVRPTGVLCALGSVACGTASALGRVVLAGPGSTAGVAAVLDAVPSDRVALLDGAFARIAPMSLTTHVIFATGAARRSDPGVLAAEMGSIAAVMSLPAAGEGAAAPRKEAEAPAAILHHPGGLYVEAAGEALRDAVVRRIAALRAAGDGLPFARIRVLIDGPVDPGIATAVVLGLGGVPASLDFALRHPVDGLLSGDLSSWPALMALATENGHRFSAQRASRFLGFTVSPYLPFLDPGTGRYSASALCPGRFLDALRAKVAVPCTDIVLEGPGKLESWLKDLV